MRAGVLGGRCSVRTKGDSDALLDDDKTLIAADSAGVVRSWDAAAGEILSDRAVEMEDLGFSSRLVVERVLAVAESHLVAGHAQDARNTMAP